MERLYKAVAAGYGAMKKLETRCWLQNRKSCAVLGVKKASWAAQPSKESTANMLCSPGLLLCGLDGLPDDSDCRPESLSHTSTDWLYYSEFVPSTPSHGAVRQQSSKTMGLANPAADQGWALLGACLEDFQALCRRSDRRQRLCL